MKRNNKKGFTIVELVIVIAVIAILAGVLIPTFSGVVRKAQENAALQEVKNAYTVYLANALTDDKEETPEEKIYVFVENGNTDFYIWIENGEATVNPNAPGDTEEFTQMYVDDSGEEETLTLTAPAASGS